MFLVDKVKGLATEKISTPIKQSTGIAAFALVIAVVALFMAIRGGK